MKEAKANSAVSKKISKKSAANMKKAAEEKVEKNIENSTAEVKGATSEETVAEKE